MPIVCLSPHTQCDSFHTCLYLFVCVCVCVYVRERDRERDRNRNREAEGVVSSVGMPLASQSLRLLTWLCLRHRGGLAITELMHVIALTCRSSVLLEVTAAIGGLVYSSRPSNVSPIKPQLCSCTQLKHFIALTKPPVAEISSHSAKKKKCANGSNCSGERGGGSSA
jgi:hypothetical protein